jgi:hypothetical protein
MNICHKILQESKFHHNWHIKLISIMANMQGSLRRLTSMPSLCFPWAHTRTKVIIVINMLGISKPHKSHHEELHQRLHFFFFRDFVECWNKTFMLLIQLLYLYYYYYYYYLYRHYHYYHHHHHYYYHHYHYHYHYYYYKYYYHNYHHHHHCHYLNKLLLLPLSLTL